MKYRLSLIPYALSLVLNQKLGRGVLLKGIHDAFGSIKTTRCKALDSRAKIVASNRKTEALASVIFFFFFRFCFLYSIVFINTLNN